MLKPILLFAITSLLFAGNNYQKIFGDDYTDGLNYFTKNKLTIENQFVKYHVDQKVLIPILIKTIKSIGLRIFKVFSIKLALTI